MTDFLYKVEYARSNNSSCKLCREKISKDVVRFAIILQSAICDRKMHYWHHEDCFLRKKILRNISEIDNFDKLLHEDQERIKAKIKLYHSASLVLPKTSKISDCKRSINEVNLNFLSTFSIEYAKSSRATCRYCDVKIPKDVMKISKSNYDPRYGDTPMWYHVSCFIKKRHELMYFSSGKYLPGFENLKPHDKITILKEITSIEDRVIIKKLKESYHTEIKTKSDEKINMEMEKPNYMFNIWKKLLNTLTKHELHVLLRENNQDVCINKKECIDRLADCMTFGVPRRCPRCKVGQIVAENSMYKCLGNINARKQCRFTSLEPKRDIMKIPDLLKDRKIFKDYGNVKNQGRFVIKKSLHTTRLSYNVHPLKNLQFLLYGKLKASKEKLKNRILNLGGLVVRKLTNTIAAVVSTKNQLDKKSNVVQKIKNDEIEVIDESFFELINPKYGTVIDSINLIIQHNIAEWKSDPFKRIPQDVIDGKTIPKLGNMYHNFQSSDAKLYVKDGIPIDSRSGLEASAHIYKEDEKVYSAVLSKANVDENRNSYYKIELWKSNDENKYWVFRAWGRIATTIGRTKLTCYTSIDDAKKEFMKIYTDKTKKLRRSKRNSRRINEDDYSDQSEAYVPIDLNYEDIKQISFKLDTASQLPKSVQLLVIKTFDTETMKKTLLQYELDVEKMPLGKLSESQIKSGYSVLSELMEEFNKNTADRRKIKEASNKFYTLIPHSVGVDKLPLLDSPEIVKDKEEMLNSLLEIEVAYKLLHLPSDDSVSPITSHYLKLKADIMPLDKNEPDFRLLLSYIKNTHAPTHSDYTLEIEEIFRVVREGEEERYEKFKGLHNKRLLWHGSRMTNLAGILSQGLRIAPPEAPQTGKMFGNGVYFADIVSKSANYCFTNKASPTGFVFVCEVALGEMKKCYKALKINSLPDGKHSTWGVGRTQPDPAQNKLLDSGVIVPLGTLIDTNANSSLLYNEFIIYNVEQVNVKYLIQFKFNFK